MDGDGHTKGAVGVGLVQAWYDFASRSVEVRATGTAAAVLQGFPRSVPAGSFTSASAQLGRLLTEYELARLPGK
jgi:hypothetical protein